MGHPFYLSGIRIPAQEGPRLNEYMEWKEKKLMGLIKAAFIFADVPQHRCDKCGWEPAAPTHPTKICPECGDPLNDRGLK